MKLQLKMRAFMLTISLFASLTLVGTVEPEVRPTSIPTTESPGSVSIPDEQSSFGENESARSDKITGGSIERGALSPGNSDVRITVNLPAFLLTLWQGDKEIENYGIGIGLKAHPVVTGVREATTIIYNPRWIPPESPWVRQSKKVRPGEVIRSSDPRNPLGKLKIPIGDAYLIHQAAKRSDIGRLVSHGCIRMLKDNIFDLAKKVMTALDISLSEEEIQRVRRTDDRRVVRLNEPLAIDINYDTLVVESRKLHIYPDVYGRNTNSVKRLRTELEAEGVNTTKVSDRSLRKMIARANRSREFVVSVSEIESGQETSGTVQALPGHSGVRN